MNRNARRFRVDIGLAYLVEAIADVLQESQGSGENSLLVETIKERAGFRNTPFINQVVRGVLNHMKQDGIVDVADDDEGYQVWRLLDV